MGQVASRRALQSLLVRLQTNWTPLKFHLDTIALIWRTADARFRSRAVSL
ncbi:hypothetical protein C2W62_21255 [Candidatus Entotheonella serta]|nr:hypothetical protein C2W62_21255 [Candidatus Entotheonella serta]